MVIRTVNSLGRSGGAHHSGRPEAWFTHIPGLKVCIPATPYDAKGLLKASIRGKDPVMVFEHALLYRTTGGVPEDDYTVPLGEAIVRREGTDVTIFAYSIMVRKALAAAEQLAAEGISVEVVDPRTLVPLDTHLLLESVRKTNRLLVAEEDCRTGGVGAEIAATVTEQAFDSLDAPPIRLASLDCPVPFSPTLERYIMPNEDDIVAATKRLLGIL